MKCNLLADELQALKELVKLQRERKIIIKQCYKGAGIMIINFDDYITACNEHLEETFEDRDGNEKFYYKIVSESALDTAKSELLALLQAGFDNKIITKEEFEEMWPKSKTASKFYCNFKIKKTYDHIPPVRPIISGSGSFVENPSKFIDHHIAELSKKHDSYIQDSPDCIKQIEDIHRK